jgi:hypothetical protein
MPLLADFQAELDGDRILVPHEIAERLRASGELRLRVRLEPASDDPRLLAARGVDEAMIAEVASMQKIDVDVAAFVLAGEGIAAGTPIGERLAALLEPAPSGTPIE